ncbi:predicted protein [Sclerotinia sclerotiorum 1980 UF-70]|uniref:Uncharacterized protein n=1 Tax=Sclerotinia sclerotiorum (strain ATCC 18683 / 1980 / Ss-1) TaxID=665079 RepID=A7EP64_SCLS1|nr:predicted protein [Sclerotinia sclerotiorum 1980 UF-70]EDO04630.1 predicted protein [Sclerotinia sclerotiorum 1980 UF-70]
MAMTRIEWFDDISRILWYGEMESADEHEYENVSINQTRLATALCRDLDVTASCSPSLNLKNEILYCCPVDENLATTRTMKMLYIKLKIELYRTTTSISLYQVFAEYKLTDCYYRPDMCNMA